ncbi:MAG: hypothetical protein QXW70_02085 [Candidatus Anstonellales archaeon]
MSKRILNITLFLVLITAISYSQLSNVEIALRDLCVFVYRLLPIVALLMLVSAGLVYAAGQIFGAETRARANVWATAMLTGSIISLIIITLTPYFLSELYGAQGYFSWDRCSFS